MSGKAACENVHSAVKKSGDSAGRSVGAPRGHRRARVLWRITNLRPGCCGSSGGQRTRSSDRRGGVRGAGEGGGPARQGPRRWGGPAERSALPFGVQSHRWGWAGSWKEKGPPMQGRSCRRRGAVRGGRLDTPPPTPAALPCLESVDHCY